MLNKYKDFLIFNKVRKMKMILFAIENDIKWQRKSKIKKIINKL